MVCCHKDTASTTRALKALTISFAAMETLGAAVTIWSSVDALVSCDLQRSVSQAMSSRIDEQFVKQEFSIRSHGPVSASVWFIVSFQ